MNIFENYLSKINKVIRDNKDSLNLVNLDNLKNVNLEVPPDHFNFDLSTNISLVLAKNNKLNPSDLAKNIKELFLININHSIFLVDGTLEVQKMDIILVIFKINKNK